MAKQKNIVQNNFTGGLNTDLADELIPNNDYRYALNIRQANTGSGNVGIITHVKGNVIVPYQLPAGYNKVIGAFADNEHNRAYYYLYNDQGYHQVLEYDLLTETLQPLLISRTQSDDVDILNFGENDLILDVALVDGKYKYWVDSGRNDLRKINVDKARAGEYGTFTPEDINANKLPPFYPPQVKYGNDATRNINKLYGHLFKFSYKFQYDDYEHSNWSDYSIVPLPVNEGVNRNQKISTTNNYIDITVNTGDRLVTKIYVGMQMDNGKWFQLGVLDKKTLNLPDRSSYTFRFYNEGSYAAIDPEKIIKPYNYLPDKPRTMSLLNERILSVAGFYEGFDDLELDVELQTSLEEHDFSENINEELNKPEISVGERHLQDKDPSWRLWRWDDLVIGADVKAGNEFIVKQQKDDDHRFTEKFIATSSDTALTMAQKIGDYFFDHHLGKEGRESAGARPLAQPIAGGDAQIKMFDDGPSDYYPTLEVSVTPVLTSTIQGETTSIKVNKSGETIQYGIVYENEKGVKTQTYSDPNWRTTTPLFTDLVPPAFMSAVHQLLIRHRPPIDAVRYQIVRTQSNKNFLQFTTQKVAEIKPTETEGRYYLDLVLEGINTYHLINPDTPIYYQFTEGDQLRFIAKIDPENNGATTFYPSNAYLIIQSGYNSQQVIEKSIQTHGGTNSYVTVPAGVEEFVEGRQIQIGDYKRRIASVVLPDRYNIDNPIDEEKTYEEYTIIEDRLTVRIEKPNLDIGDINLVELYTPLGLIQEDDQIFFEFGAKYGIANAGTDLRAHLGKEQNQSENNPSTVPAIISIHEGDVYMRLRELPISNAFPGTQLTIQPIEDPGFSDYYESRVNDNGRASAQFEGATRTYLDSTIRYSNNFIPGTQINGLNDFDSSDKEEYSDPYGGIVRLYFRDGLLFVFKELRTGYIPISKQIITDTEGQELVATSSTLLSDLKYYAFSGGIGGNPESLAPNNQMIYFASANGGAIVRLGGDGITALSISYFMDRQFKEWLYFYSKNGGRIFGGFDRNNTEYLMSFQTLKDKVFNGDFSQGRWQTVSVNDIDATTFEIVAQPTKGTLGTITVDGEVDYTANAGASGSDSFTYRVKDSQDVYLPTRRICINITTPVRDTAWRPINPACEVNENLEQSGYFTWQDLEEFYVDTIVGGDIYTATPTGVVKPNTKFVDGEPNPDYIDQVFYNVDTCPPVVPMTATMELTYGNDMIGATLLIQETGDILAVGVASAGVISKNVELGVGQTYTIVATILKTSTAGVNVNGVGRTVSAPYTGTQVETFTDVAAGDITAIFSNQPVEWIGANPVCIKGITKTITGFNSPYHILYEPSNQRMYVSNYKSAVVQMIDAVAQSLMGTTINVTLQKGRMLAKVPSTNTMFLSNEASYVYMIDMVNNTAVQKTSGQTYTGGCHYIPMFNAIVICDTSGGMPAAGRFRLVDPVTGNYNTSYSLPHPSYYAHEVTNLPGGVKKTYVGTNNGRLIVFIGTDPNFDKDIALPSLTGVNNYTSPFTQKGTMVYLCNQGSKRLYRIDGETDIVVDSVDFQFLIDRVLYIPARDRLYVSSQSGDIFEVHPETFDFLNVIKLAGAKRPIFMEYDPTRDVIYVTDHGNQTANSADWGNSVYIVGQNTNTGKAVYTTLRETYTLSLVVRSEKNNEPLDPDYIPEFDDPTNCAVAVLQLPLFLKVEHRPAGTHTEAQGEFERVFDDGSLFFEFFEDAEGTIPKAVTNLNVLVKIDKTTTYGDGPVYETLYQVVTINGKTKTTRNFPRHIYNRHVENDIYDYTEEFVYSIGTSNEYDIIH